MNFIVKRARLSGTFEFFIKHFLTVLMMIRILTRFIKVKRNRVISNFDTLSDSILDRSVFSGIRSLCLAKLNHTGFC